MTRNRVRCAESIAVGLLVPVEKHLCVNGGHAFGLRRTKDPITEWPLLVQRWLGKIGVLGSPGGQ